MNTSPVALTDRLLPFNEALLAIGFKSRTSMYKLINAGVLKPVTRGRNQLFLESEVLDYLATLVAQRDVQQKAA